MTKEIPSKFVWTKMSTHAGEPLDNIIRRKMLECDAGEGKFANAFWWGVGDSRGPAILIHLADRDPEVLFSEMPSKPRSKDSHPGKCFIWTTYRVCDSDESSGYGGKSLHVPNNIIVCDSEKEKSGPIKRKNYYALVCGRPRQCEQSEMKPLYVDNMKNLKRDGNLGKTGPKTDDRRCGVFTTRQNGWDGVSRQDARESGAPLLRRIGNAGFVERFAGSFDQGDWRQGQKGQRIPRRCTGDTEVTGAETRHP